MKLEELNKAGFRRVGQWRAQAQGGIRLDAALPLSDAHAVYVFADEAEAIRYIGQTAMALSRRMYFYGRPGPTQKTNIRLNALIQKHLAEGGEIHVYAAWPGDTEWNGLPVHLYAGLEHALICKCEPIWNKGMKPKRLVVTEEQTGSVRARRPMAGGIKSDAAFWVYINDTRKRGAIHVAHCRCCNHGRGLHGGKSESGYWRRFETREKARRFTKEVGYRDIAACQFCGG